MTRLQILPPALFVGFVIGCGGSDTIEVSGTVTYDGESVEKGDISFIATDGDGGSSGGPIEGGEYRFETTPGNKRVEIRGSRPLPPERQPDPEMGTAYEDFIPATYNRESTLTVEVQADGEREFPFALTPP